MIIFRQNGNQVLHKKHSIIITKHEPINIRFIKLHNFLYYTRHSNGGFKAAFEGIREGRCVFGDYYRRERGIYYGAIVISSGVDNFPIKESESTRGGGVVP
jgi:hypothetical protein